MTTTQTPNHHGHHPGFAGPTGLLAALSMTVGRGGDARLAAELTRLGPDDAVVDVGCGPGTAVRHAARVGARVTGVDPAPVMLRVARALTLPSRRVHYRAGGAEALPLPDHSATVLWSLATVHHWSDLDAGLREALRVLQSGGRFLTIERHTQPGARGLASHGWTDDQAAAFAAHCEALGFIDAGVGRHTAGRRSTVSVLTIAP
jgi:ubiquinone/menaquinone biosynthesis C-methylase UbiE